MSINPNQITATILAGGQSSRMYHQDKGLILFNKKPLVQHVSEVIKPKVAMILISANRNLSLYQKYTQEPIINDDLSDFQGPLAGFAKAMEVAKTPYLLVLPCDCPFLSPEIIEELASELIKNNAEISVAFDGKRLQPTFALLKTKLLPSLNDYLKAGNRKIDLWYNLHRLVKTHINSSHDFVNFNNPQDYAKFYKPSTINNVPILGIAAFSGTGKTTLLTQIIKNLNNKNLKIGFIKHGHHNFEIDYPGKDSYECFHAGAHEIIIGSAKKYANICNTNKDLSLFELGQKLDLNNLDLVLIEGFKKENFAKIELQRSDLNNPALYPNDLNIIAIASDQPENLAKDASSNRVILDINNITEITDFILAYAKQ